MYRSFKFDTIAFGYFSFVAYIFCVIYTHTILFLFVCLFFVFSRAVPTAFGGSQARGGIRAVAAGLRQSHNYAGSEPHLQPTPQLTAMPDP